MGSEWAETVALILAWANGRLASWQSGGCDLKDPDDPDPDPTLAYVSPLGAPGMTVSVYRAAVHATYGSFEDLEHVLHLRPKGGITPDTSAAGCLALAARIGAAWSAWWNDTTAGAYTSTLATKTFFNPSLAYDQINISYLTYPGGGDPPETVTPTQQWSFSAPLAGTSTNQYPLPAEVACALTFLTDTAGPTTRGRMYLGGLTADWMDNAGGPEIAGLFVGFLPRLMGYRFGAKVIDGLHTDEAAQAEIHVVSRKNGSSRGVGGVRVGSVPDSQRRRRWHQPENPVLVWGSA
jgi:hypothetical protein